jgi:hypothetical protein
MPQDDTIGTTMEIGRGSAKLQAAREAERAERDIQVAREFTTTARLADALASAPR